MRMRRYLYLSTLFILQLALIMELASPIAHALRADAAPGTAPSGWPAMLQLVATGAAVAGTSLALVFPGLALARHRRVGVRRFLGMPRWAVTLSLVGAAALVAGTVIAVLAPFAPPDWQITAALIARPFVAGGLALATAGVLCAELLRRNLASAHASRPDGFHRPGRVEVTHPPELRTRSL
jgi:hypothetical protein